MKSNLLRGIALFRAAFTLALLFAGLVFLSSWINTSAVHAAATSAPTDDFVITVITDNYGTSASTQFTIPTKGGGYNYNVDCNNDGTNEATAQTGNYTCSYGAAGIYTVRIKDNTGLGTGFPRIFFNHTGDRLKLLTIEQWGTGKWTSMNLAFAGCANLAGQATDNPDLTNVTNMGSMFAYASAFNQDIASWNTANVIDVSRMFVWVESFNQNIGSWNTANVTEMRGMFYGASTFNQDIGSWNTGNVTNMRRMFHSALALNQDIGNWNTANVTDASGMFLYASTFNQNIGSWNTVNVTNMRRMFYAALTFNQNIGSWNTANVTNMSSMFYGAWAFNQDIGSWNTASVTKMRGMFSSAWAFNQNLGSWNTANVTNMSSMFYGAGAFNQNLGSWNTANVTNMSSMFYDADAFNQDIGGWNTANVTDMGRMFTAASTFNQNIGSWNVGALTEASNMFFGVTLSTTNYDALLNGWDAQTLQPSVPFSGGNSKYCAGASARSHMIFSDLWNITDGGIAELVKPTLLKPTNNAVVSNPRVKLDWDDVYCATSYKVTVKDMATGIAVFKTTITYPLVSSTKTGVLPAGTYQWFVTACNEFGCSKSSKFVFTK